MANTPIRDEIMHLVNALPEEGQRELLVYLKTAAAARAVDPEKPEESGSMACDTVDPNAW